MESHCRQFKARDICAVIILLPFEPTAESCIFFSPRFWWTHSITRGVVSGAVMTVQVCTSEFKPMLILKSLNEWPTTLHTLI